ncbi:MAG: hypothetical protein BIFFINMI_03024 [Phycisphaerae bacterium]|nr:hypothetical protein [Phycisphaerae bacterium]
MADEDRRDGQSPTSADSPSLDIATDASTGVAAARPQGNVVTDGAGAGRHADLPDLTDVVLGADEQPIDLLNDVELNVKVELGRCRMLVEDVLKLSEGAVVELEKLAGDPVDVFVNDRLVARGEVLVLNDTFCVRVNEIVSAEAADETV